MLTNEINPTAVGVGEDYLINQKLRSAIKERVMAIAFLYLTSVDKIDSKGQHEVKQTTVAALLDAYNRLQEIIFDLYAEYEKAMQIENYADASLLAARAERLFEEAESIIVVIREQTNG